MKNKKVFIVVFITSIGVLALTSKLTDSIAKNWTTYVSNSYEVSLSIPNDWKEVMPSDGSLRAISSIEDYTIISSPGKKESMVFISKPVDISGINCQKKAITINKNKIIEISCPTSPQNTMPGKLNYEFSDKNLFIATNGRTETISKILSSIK